jgi:glycine/D-amino acid oxidase-like deaminating enzyme
VTPIDRRGFLKTAGASLALGAQRLRARQQAVTRPGAEIVVVGAGAFGGWTALYLRDMGFSVRLVDRYGPGNSRATSGGESRQIRAGYGNREIYRSNRGFRSDRRDLYSKASAFSACSAVAFALMHRIERDVLRTRTHTIARAEDQRAACRRSAIILSV